jgi:hypothetical protein
MYIIEVSSGVRNKVVIIPVEQADFKILTRKRYSFTWNSLKRSASIYKLLIEGEEDILGAMALIDYPLEKRMEIKLLTCSVENKGKAKKYDRIAGCLISYACHLCVDHYSQDACVSLVPKTELIQHYMEKYHMLHAGWQLYLEGDRLENLLNEYYHEL